MSKHKELIKRIEDYLKNIEDVNLLRDCKSQLEADERALLWADDAFKVLNENQDIIEQDRFELETSWEQVQQALAEQQLTGE